MLNYVRKGIVKSIFDFKEIIKGFISTPRLISQTTKDHFKELHANYFSNKTLLK